MNRSTRGGEPVVVEGVIQWVTDKGIKVLFDDDSSVINDWLPKSQIKACSISTITEKHVGRSAVFTIPRWLAENKGVSYMEESEWEDKQDTEVDELNFSEEDTSEETLEELEDIDDDIPF